MSTSEQIVDTDPRIRFEREKRRQFEISAARRKRIRDEMVAMERIVYMALALGSFIMLTVIAFK